MSNTVTWAVIFGSLAYANDIVLVVPSFDVHKMLSTCDKFAADIDVFFSALNSKYVIPGSKRARYCAFVSVWPSSQL